MNTHNTSINRDIDIEVTYQYHKAIRGHRDSYGAPEEPDEPAYLEITSVNPEIELTEREEDNIKEEILSMLNEPPEP